MDEKDQIDFSKYFVTTAAEESLPLKGETVKEAFEGLQKQALQLHQRALIARLFGGNIAGEAPTLNFPTWQPDEQIVQGYVMPTYSKEYIISGAVNDCGPKPAVFEGSILTRLCKTLEGDGKEPELWFVAVDGECRMVTDAAYEAASYFCTCNKQLDDPFSDTASNLRLSCRSVGNLVSIEYRNNNRHWLFTESVVAKEELRQRMKAIRNADRSNDNYKMIDF